MRYRSPGFRRPILFFGLQLRVQTSIMSVSEGNTVGLTRSNLTNLPGQTTLGDQNHVQEADHEDLCHRSSRPRHVGDG